MDKDTAARIIQRWFRSKFAKNECTISHSNFLSNYEVIIDKQSYNANEMLASIVLCSSLCVPHSRRKLSESEFEHIHEKYDPFDMTYRLHKDRRHTISNDYSDDVIGCSPRPPLSFILNKTSILYVQ